jgi:putative phosphoesterase
MKYLVVSDIHGSSYYANKINEIYNKEEPDKIILLGDLYYHGPRNPLTKEYNPMKVCEIFNNLKDKILCIKGNCDAEVDEMISEFKFNESISIDINGLKFFFTHGHKYNIDNIPEGIDVLVYGHFHTGFIKEKDGVICVNSGSISLPKENTKNSYLIIDENEMILKDVEGEIIEKRII